MKKALALFLSLAMCAGMFAGCTGNGGAAGSSTPADASSAPVDSAASSETSSEEPKELSGEFTYWTFTDFSNNLVKSFQEKNSGVKVDIQVFGGDEYKTKLLTTLQSGQDIPDLFDLEASYVYEFLDSDLLENLSNLGFEDSMKDFYGYVLSTSRDSKGQLKGVNFQTSPVCLWYLRDATKQWLGTDDPDQITEMLGSVDKIMETAKSVNEKSGGKVSLMANMGDFGSMMAYNFTPLVREGKFNLTDEWTGMIDTMRNFYNSGYDPELGGWSEDWAAKWNAGELLIRVMPSWDYFTDWDKNTGNVGIATPFSNTYEGGTIVSMWSGSEKKDLGEAFLRFLCSDEFQTKNMNDNNQVPASKTISQELAKSYTSEKFGGQNLMAAYDKINAGISDVIPDKYTFEMMNLFKKHANDGIKNNLTNEDIVKNFKAEAKDKRPEIEGLN